MPQNSRWMSFLKNMTHSQPKKMFLVLRKHKSRYHQPLDQRRINPDHILYTTVWAKMRYTVIIFFFTGIVSDGRELKYRTKKWIFNLNVKVTNVNI